MVLLKVTDRNRDSVINDVNNRVHCSLWRGHFPHMCVCGGGGVVCVGGVLCMCVCVCVCAVCLCCVCVSEYRLSVVPVRFASLSDSRDV